jgi:polar amino acid transport system permease protein
VTKQRSVSGNSRLIPHADRLKALPFWLLGIILMGILVVWRVAGRSDYRVIGLALSRGIVTTLSVSLTAFAFSILLGLALGILRVSRSRILREAATFVVEIIRGIPMLVILYYIAFVGAPFLVTVINGIFSPLSETGWLSLAASEPRFCLARDTSPLRTGTARSSQRFSGAGIESIHRGQMEAAMALGMSRVQGMRYIVFRRRYVPFSLPWNEFVAMIKELGLVFSPRVQDITQLERSIPLPRSSF